MNFGGIRMPVRKINGINLSYEEVGTGDPVLLIPGTGARGTIFRAHQVSALVQAGFRAVMLDNRGMAPTNGYQEDFTIDDMVDDVAGLIESLAAGPCRVVGFSMGALVAQELLLARPDLVTQAVLMATRGRTDALSAAYTAAQLEVLDRGIKTPPLYEASVRIYQGFSRRTMRDEQAVRNWLDLFEMSIEGSSVSRSQLKIDQIPDRLAHYRRITTDTLVLAFSEDVMAPPYLGREVADAIQGATFREISGCGHFGYVEAPDAVNTAIINFFAGDRPSGAMLAGHAGDLRGCDGQ
jgi:pimeloyl-ACP methyl ester carboxylesterase